MLQYNGIVRVQSVLSKKIVVYMYVCIVVGPTLSAAEETVEVKWS